MMSLVCPALGRSISGAAFSPDGRLMVSGTQQGNILVYEIATRKLLQTLTGHTSAEMKALVFSPDGKLLASASGDRTVKLWDIREGRLLNTLFDGNSLPDGERYPMTGLTFSPDGKTLAGGTYNGDVWFWNVPSGETKALWKDVAGNVSSIAFSPDGKRLALGTYQNDAAIKGRVTHEEWPVQVWNVANKERLWTSPGHTKTAEETSFSPDGRTLASTGRDGAIRLWDAATGKPLHVLQADDWNMPPSMAWSPDGETLASDGSKLANQKRRFFIKLWHARSGKLLGAMEVRGWLPVLRFALNGQELQNLSWINRKEGLWEIQSRRVTAFKRLRGQTSFIPVFINGKPQLTPLHLAQFFKAPPATKRLSSKDRRKRRRAASPGRPELVLQLGHAGQVDSLNFTPDGKTLISGGYDGLKLWDVPSGNLRRDIPNSPLRAVSFAPNGKTLIGEKDDSNVQVRDATSGELLGTVPNARLSPDGYRLIRFANNSALKSAFEFYSVRTGKLLGAIAVDPSLFSTSNVAFVFSRDGKLVAVAGGGQAQIARVATGEVLHTLKDPRGEFGSNSGVSGPLAFSPDGALLATCGEDPKYYAVVGPGDPGTEASFAHDRAVKLWDTRTGKLLRVLPGHYNLGGGTQLLTFTRDGKSLVSVGRHQGSDHQVDVWNVATGRLQRTSNGPNPARAISPDGRFLAGASQLIELWDVQTGKKLRTLADASPPTTSLGFSPDGRWMASGHDGVTRLWDARTARLKRVLPHFLFDRPLFERVAAVGFPRSDELLAFGSYETKLWNTQTGKLLRSLYGPISATRGDNERENILVSPDGKTMVTKSHLGPPLLSVWDTPTQTLRLTIKDFNGSFSDAAFTPDGKRLASTVRVSGSSPSPPVVKLWNLETGQVERVFAGDKEKTTNTRYRFGSPEQEVVEVTGEVAGPLAFSPDGRTLLTGGYTGVRLWDVMTGARRLALRQVSAQSAAFSPDGRMIAIRGNGDQQGDVRLFEASSGVLLHTLPANFDFSDVIAFSSDSKKIAVVERNTIKLWNIATQRLSTIVILPSSKSVRFPFVDKSVAWVTLTPSGYYDASPGAETFIRWRVGNKLFPAATYAKRFHRPDLVRKALETK